MSVPATVRFYVLLQDEDVKRRAENVNVPGTKLPREDSVAGHGGGCRTWGDSSDWVVDSP